MSSKLDCKLMGQEASEGLRSECEHVNKHVLMTAILQVILSFQQPNGGSTVAGTPLREHRGGSTVTGTP